MIKTSDRLRRARITANPIIAIPNQYVGGRVWKRPN